MNILVSFKNPKTGEVRPVGCGFSWTLFFFGFTGVPLFYRKLNVKGAIEVFLLLLCIFAGNTFIWGCFLLVHIWNAIKGNEMTAKNYLDLGWQLAEPNSELTRMAMQHWSINVPESVAATDVPAANNTAITSPPLSYPPSYKPSKAPIFVGITLTVLIVLGLVIELGSSGGNAGIELGADGIPKCDSEGAKATAKGALEDSQYSKFVNVKILSFEAITTGVPGSNGSANCFATILTNGGRHDISYTISKMADGKNYYLEVERFQ